MSDAIRIELDNYEKWSLPATEAEAMLFTNAKELLQKLEEAQTKLTHHEAVVDAAVVLAHSTLPYKDESGKACHTLQAWAIFKRAVIEHEEALKDAAND